MEATPIMFIPTSEKIGMVNEDDNDDDDNDDDDDDDDVFG